MYKSCVIHNKSRKKGVISVYTLIICSIILLLSIYTLSLKYESYLYSLNSIRILKDENFNINKKEHLKNQLYNILNLNITNITKDKLQQFLNNQNGEKILFKEGNDSIILKKGFIRFNYENHSKFGISEDFTVELKDNNFILIAKE